jgi:hypothetical protein
VGPGPTAAPSAADVDAIAANADRVVRNLQITQCYSELSRAFAEVARGGSANWCTYATWASKQAGQTIRKEDLQRTFERLFGRSEEATAAGNGVVRAMADLSARRGPDRVWEAVRRALNPDAPFEASADAVVRGNRKVFAEIGREFARFLAVVRPDGSVPQSDFQAFRSSLRPGEPPDGQGYLRQAFDAYVQAFAATDSGERAQLMLFGNLAIGWHEQTRLQPEIAEALDAPFAEPVKLRRDLLKELAKTRIGLALRVLFQLLPGRATRLKQQLDALDRHVRELAREVVTEHLMTLAVPGRTLDLGRDVPGTFPERLATVANPDLRALLDRIDPTPDTTRGSGTRDWARLPERIHYIADLFRVNQEDERLYEPPFTADQVAVIRSGGRPPGRL